MVQKTFNRWLIPVAAVAIHICIGSVYAWSTFNRPIKALFPNDPAWFSPPYTTFSTALVLLGLSAAFGGPWGVRFELDPAQGGGLFALKLLTGEKVWSAAPPVCARANCSPAQSAAVTAIPGAVFSGSIDGHLRAYSSITGEVIWDFDTVREYDTVNGGKARGGSLDAGGPAVVDGMLYVNSGYAQFGGVAGNVLLAFSIDGK